MKHNYLRNDVRTWQPDEQNQLVSKAYVTRG
jgi:hypothetical protein